MHTNDTNPKKMTINKNEKLLHPELSYQITGICFDVHNELGRYCREKQYSDMLEKKLNEKNVPHKREHIINKSGNIADFVIYNKIIIELKAKDFISKDGYYQTQRYLQASNIKLGLIINFRNKYLKPIRIVKIDTNIKNKFL